MQKRYVSRRLAPEKLLNTIGEEERKKKKNPQLDTSTCLSKTA